MMKQTYLHIGSPEGEYIFCKFSFLVEGFKNPLMLGCEQECHFGTIATVEEESHCDWCTQSTISCAHNDFDKGKQVTRF